MGFSCVGVGVFWLLTRNGFRDSFFFIFAGTRILADGGGAIGSQASMGFGTLSRPGCGEHFSSTSTALFQWPRFFFSKRFRYQERKSFSLCQKRIERLFIVETDILNVSKVW